MKQLAFVTLVALGFLGALTLPAASQTADSLQVKVTPRILSVNVNQSQVNYGSLSLSGDNIDRSRASSGPIPVTNTGTVPINLMVRGSNATSSVGGDSTWILNCDPAATGTVGSNQYAHLFGMRADQLSALCPATDKSLAGPIAPANGSTPAGSVDLHLEMNMPTSTTGFGERTSTVIITATQ